MTTKPLTPAGQQLLGQLQQVVAVWGQLGKDWLLGVGAQGCGQAADLVSAMCNGSLVLLFDIKKKYYYLVFLVWKKKIN